MGALLDAGNASFPGQILAVMQALAALLLVAGLVWFGRRALLGGRFGVKRSERIQLEERFALDLRNALVIVRVEQRRLLLATSDHGPARLIAELSAGEATPPPPAGVEA
jgi:flagellar biogenesis protein FliO